MLLPKRCSQDSNTPQDHAVLLQFGGVERLAVNSVNVNPIARGTQYYVIMLRLNGCCLPLSYSRENVADLLNILGLLLIVQHCGWASGRIAQKLGNKLFGLRDVVVLSIDTHGYTADLFLALLDYVSRAHGAQFVRRPSVRRPSVRVAIISELNARISFKFSLWLPLGYTLGRFLNF